MRDQRHLLTLDGPAAFVESKRQQHPLPNEDADQGSIEKDLWPEWLRVLPDLHAFGLSLPMACTTTWMTLLSFSFDIPISSDAAAKTTQNQGSCRK